MRARVLPRCIGSRRARVLLCVAAASRAAGATCGRCSATAPTPLSRRRPRDVDIVVVVHRMVPTVTRETFAVDRAQQQRRIDHRSAVVAHVDPLETCRAQAVHGAVHNVTSAAAAQRRAPTDARSAGAAHGLRWGCGEHGRPARRPMLDLRPSTRCPAHHNLVVAQRHRNARRVSTGSQFTGRARGRRRRGAVDSVAQRRHG